MRNATLLLLAACSLAPAQTPGQLYRDAYSAWREVNPNLEREAVTATPAQWADKLPPVRAAASRYAAAHGAYVRSFADSGAQFVLWLENAKLATPVAFSNKEWERMLAQASTDLTAEIKNYQTDPDRGIQQLRQALEREKAAIASLTSAMAEREKAAAKSAQTLEPLDALRLKSLEQYQRVAKSLETAARQADQEAAAWASYYQVLEDALRTPQPAATESSANTPVKVEPDPSGVVVNGIRINNPVNPGAPAPPKPAAEPTSVARITPPAKPAPSAPAALPLGRYTGEWEFPASGGLFHGLQPQRVEAQIIEANGVLSGTLTALFKAPGGTEPALSLEFSGPTQTGRVQRLPLRTSDGRMGFLELIPGPAFNLLEINFQAELRAGLVHLGNFMLIKK